MMRKTWSTNCCRHRDPKVELLARHRLFQRCEPADLVAVARLADIIEIPAGTPVRWVGRHGDWFTVVLDGLLTVEHQQHAVVLSSCSALNCSASWPGQPGVTAIALTDTTLLEFRPRELNAIARTVTALASASAVAALNGEPVISLTNHCAPC